jgi:RNA polymerase-binding transcription factor DksA
MNDREYIGRAKINPASEFKHPMDVVAANDIATAEKLAILRAWEADERALQRAETEGMGGGEHAHLHKVQEALARLEEAGFGHCQVPADSDPCLVGRVRDGQHTHANHAA